MSKSYPIIERHSDGVVVIARTVVEAQQAAGDALGGDCTITSVEKVREGGIGGFFATELMRVTATPSRFRSVDSELRAGLSSAEDLLTSMREKSPQFVDRLISELRQSVTPADAEPAAVRPAAAEPAAAQPSSDIAAYVKQPLSPQPAPAPAVASAPVPVSPPATVTPAADVRPQRTEPAVPDALVQRIQRSQQQPVAQPVGPQQASTHPISVPVEAVVAQPPQRPVPRPDSRWSHQSLRALGLPDRIVDTALVHQPSTESEWIVALMGAFAEICAPAPLGPTIMMGPACANLARQLKLVSVGTEELAESISSVAVPHVTAKVARFARNDRFVHLMVGGNWHHLSGIEAQVVSAATSADLLEAIRVCAAWNAVLGWCWAGSAYERLDQFTVVAHIRSILYGAEQLAPVVESAMAFA